jgi:hypothetical protein
MRISCRGLGASGLGRKLPTHGPLPETAAEFEPSDRMCQRRAALIVFRGGDALAAFDQHTREAIGMLLIRLHGQSNGVNEMFWGLWLLPFGWLVARSRFLPRWLGYWLLLDGICWVVLAVTGFLAPAYHGVLFRAFQPAFLAELAIMLWLLIVGAKENALAADAGAS